MNFFKNIFGHKQSSNLKVTGYFTDIRDGKTYQTIKIGTQTWMVENLAYKASSGCYAYDNNATNVTKYGYLYDWETAKKVCPSGWHLPSDAEWSTLTNYVGRDEGEKLKSTSGWDSSDNGTDAYGFTALPGGFRLLNDTFLAIGHLGTWWSSTDGGAAGAYYRLVGYNYCDVVRSYGGMDDDYSVRCIKD